MVTANRVQLAERAIRCLVAQTWPNRELVIVDDGEEDYEPMLSRYREAFPIHYLRIAPRKDRHLGDLRNCSLDAAGGELAIQWDDDDWYHPERITRQVRFLEENKLDAVFLRHVLWHLNEPGFAGHLFRTDGRDGYPGTVLHRKTGLRYPNLPRSEDLVFMNQWKRLGRAGFLPHHAELFIRCFHGRNTWDKEHFLGKLKGTIPGRIAYGWATKVAGDLRRHPAFRLSESETRASESFISLSRELGLFAV